MDRVIASWRDRSVLVTGGAGFLGRWTIRALERGGARITGIDIEPTAATWDPLVSQFVKTIDARDCRAIVELLRENEVEVIIHLAAQSLVGRAKDDPLATFENNVQGTWSVLEACRRVSGIRAVVVASSDKAFGDAKGVEYDETMPLEARNLYDVSKACADMIAQSFASTYGLPVAITRCGNLYGGGDVNWSRIVPGTIRSLLHNERPIIRSDGTFIRDYLYVEDAVTGLLTLASEVPARRELWGEAFNFAAGDRHSVLEIVDKLMDQTGVRLTPEVRNEAVGEIREQRLSTAKAHTLLGWAPRTSIDNGLAQTVEWYRGFLR